MAAEATSKHDSVSVCILSNGTAMCNYINVEYNILQVGSGRDGVSVLYLKKKNFSKCSKMLYFNTVLFKIEGLVFHIINVDSYTLGLSG